MIFNNDYLMRSIYQIYISVNKDLSRICYLYNFQSFFMNAKMIQKAESFLHVVSQFKG